MVKLKVGRNIIELDEKDLILDNGACYWKFNIERMQKLGY